MKKSFKENPELRFFSGLDDDDESEVIISPAPTKKTVKKVEKQELEKVIKKQEQTTAKPTKKAQNKTEKKPEREIIKRGPYKPVEDKRSHRLQLVLTESQYDELKEEARKENLSVNSYVVRAIVRECKRTKQSNE